MALTAFSPQVQSPQPFAVAGRPGAFNAAGKISWSPSGHPVFSVPIPRVQVTILEVSGSVKFGPIRGVEVDNTQSRVPVTVRTTDSQWSFVVDPGASVQLPVPTGAASILFLAPLGAMATDVTAYVLTNYHLSPMIISPKIWRSDNTGLAITEPVAGAPFFYVLNPIASTGGPVSVFSGDGIVTRLKVDVDFVATGDGTVTLALENNTSGGKAEWEYVLQIDAARAQPLFNLFTLYPGDYILAPGGLNFLAAVAGATFSSGAIQVTGMVQ